MSVTGFTAGELTKLRAGKTYTPVYCAVHVPRTTLTATVASEPTWPTDGTGAATLALSSISTPLGAGAVKGGQKLQIGSDPRNVLRLRDGTATSPINIAATSASALNIQPGDAVTVYEDYQIAAKRMRYDTSGSAWYVDYDLAYTDQNENIPPIAIAGPAAIAYGAGSQSFAFTGASSYGFNGASITGHSWTFPDGSTSASETPTFSTSTAYPNGRWVEYTATDSNGKTQTTRRLLWKFDTANPPYTAFVVGQIAGEWGKGWGATVRVMGAATTATFPVGAHVALFTAQTFAGSAANIGGNFPGRENILLEGWIVSSAVKRDPFVGVVEFEIATAEALADKQYAFPIDLSDTTGTPASWLEMQNLTLDKGMAFLARYNSTLAEVVDVYLTGQQTPTITAASSDTIKFLNVPPDTLFGQARFIYDWLIGGTVGADSQSAIWCEQDAQIAKTWASLPTMLAMLPQDRRGNLELKEIHQKVAAQNTLYGIDYDTVVGSRAPDDPLDYGEKKESRDSRIHATQAQLNQWAGAMTAQQNNQWPNVHIETAGAYRVDPTPQSVITWTPTSTEAPRYPAWTAQPLIVRRATYALDPRLGVLLADLEAEPKNEGPDGVPITIDTPAAAVMGNPTIIGMGADPSITWWPYDADAEGWETHGSNGQGFWSTQYARTGGALRYNIVGITGAGGWQLAYPVTACAGDVFAGWVQGYGDSRAQLLITYSGQSKTDVSGWFTTGGWQKLSVAVAASNAGKTIDHLIFTANPIGPIATSWTWDDASYTR